MSCAALIYGSSFHYLDHLAPLCEVMQIPLIVTEEEVEQRLLAFYPKVQVLYVDYIRLPEYVVSTFQVLFVCTPKALFEEVFFFAQVMHRKKVHTVWCPHGNSDKGHVVPYMQGLKQEEALLVYGEKMIDFLQDKGVELEHKAVLQVGNYRLEYYLRHQEFYDGLVERQILRAMPKNRKNILYAPTWDDDEESSSFSSALPSLVKGLGAEYNLLIKPHPNLLLDCRHKEMIEQYREKEGVFFILDFPAIYPLLAAMDVYIGDFSSIGYDALFFDKPLFFLNDKKRDAIQDPGLYLYRCGVEIKQESYKDLCELIKKEKPVDKRLFSDIRKEVYAYTFYPKMELKELKEYLEAFCRPFLEEKDLPFF